MSRFDVESPLPEGSPFQLLLGRDRGGERYFLERRPVRCGMALELRLPSDSWVRVRFEMGPVFDRTAGKWKAGPVLFIALGHQWEQRFIALTGRAIAELAELDDLDPARWYVFDQRRGLPVRRTDHHAPEPGGEPRPMWPDLDRESFSYRRDAEDLARVMCEVYEPCPSISIPVVPEMELRWPKRTLGGAP